MAAVNRQVLLLRASSCYHRATGVRHIPAFAQASAHLDGLTSRISVLGNENVDERPRSTATEGTTFDSTGGLS